MELIAQLALQLAEMTLVLTFAPLLTGFVRLLKARLQRRAGPPLLQAYRELAKLIAKDAIVATDASWLFRVAPYLIFTTTWVAASLVPSFGTNLLFSWSGDLIVIVALLGSARFVQMLAALDVGTAFGGLGASREAMIASLAEPALGHCRIHAFGGSRTASLPGACSGIAGNRRPRRDGAFSG
jgi:formate hydrogenlyase subunit 4